MTTTIVNGGTTITPTLVLGYVTARTSGNTFHKVIGRIDPAVVLADDAPRAGTLELFFDTRAAAWTAYAALGVARVWVLADTDLAQVSMSFTRRDAMNIALDPDTRTRWVVSVGYQEVLA